MKKLVLLFAISVMLLACSSSGPENAAKNFTENLAKGKIEEAKKYCTESTGQLLDFGNSLAGGVDIYPDYKFKLVKTEKEDSKATVTYIDPEGGEETLELVKIDGHWKVNIQNQK